MLDVRQAEPRRRRRLAASSALVRVCLRGSARISTFDESGRSRRTSSKQIVQVEITSRLVRELLLPGPCERKGVEIRGKPLEHGEAIAGRLGTVGEQDLDLRVASWSPSRPASEPLYVQAIADADAAQPGTPRRSRGSRGRGRCDRNPLLTCWLPARLGSPQATALPRAQGWKSKLDGELEFDFQHNGSIRGKGCRRKVEPRNGRGRRSNDGGVSRVVPGTMRSARGTARRSHLVGDGKLIAAIFRVRLGEVVRDRRYLPAAWSGVAQRRIMEDARR